MRIQTGAMVAWVVIFGYVRSQTVAEEIHPDEAAVLKRLEAAGFTYNVSGDKRLRQIFAGQENIAANLLAQLEACRDLQSISLGQDPSHFEAMEGLPMLHTLELLGVAYPLRGNPSMSWTQRLPNLQALNLEAPESKELLPERALWRPGDSDLAVGKLRFLDNLLVLRLNRQQITAAGLAPLVRLEKLRHLELNGTPVDDAALEHVAKLDQLETLHLAGTAITDRGLAHLGSLTRLENLKLDGTAITDEGLDTLREFEGLRGLKYLYLADTKITDQGLAALADLKSLEVLDLTNTQITEKGLVHLAELKNLYNLGLQGLRAEEESVRWLEDQLPKRNALWGYTPPEVPLALKLHRKQRPELEAAAMPPILKAAHDWNMKGDAKSALRVLELASRLRGEVSKHLPFQAYADPLEVTTLSGLPAASPGRHTLLGSVRYASSRPPGPGESYINTCLVFLDGDLLDAGSLNGSDKVAEPALFNGYISRSVVVVDGAIGIRSYIGDSIVIAAGPIVVTDGYISNSLVISLDALQSPDKANQGSPPGRPTIYVREGYVNNSVILGDVACDDLRNSIVLGRVATREPYLRGAEILPSGPAAALPWEVGRP